MSKHLIWLAVFVLSACTSDTIKSPQGVEIKFLSKGQGEELEVGKILMMSATYQTEDGRVLGSSSQENPLALYNEQNPIEKGGLLKDVLNQLKIGDSVYFEIPTKNLFEVSFQAPVPDSIDSNSNIRFNLMVFDQLTREEYAAYMRELELKMNQPYFEEEEKRLVKFLEDNKITTELDNSGVRVVMKKEGNGERPSNGDRVNVGYSGSTLNGNVFDSGTYQFVLGAGEVIKGWDIGIGLLTKGAKADLYIPSRLGYGSRGSGRNIPPFASLKFEVELIDIQKQ